MSHATRIRLLLGVVLFAIATSALSPYYALHRISRALEQRDADALADYVDFAALRESIKGQVLMALQTSKGEKKERQTPFASIGQALAAALIGPLVDTMVSPAGLTVMLATGHPSSLVDGKEQGTDQPHAPRFAATYKDWNRMVFQPEAKTGDDTVKFILKRQGWYRWKLAAVELPVNFSVPTK
jgi:hypothetical protein